MLKTELIFSDGMILQREKEVKIWGWTDSDSQILVAIQGKEAAAYPDSQGEWTVTLPPLEASENETMLIKNDSEQLVIRDIAVGEVWIAGGQSNMEFPLCYEKHGTQEMKTKNKNLRFYDVPKLSFADHGQTFEYSHVGKWRKAQEGDLQYFSAAGYYMQKELEAELSVPVGIIGCNYGGTRSCAWMSEKTVSEVGALWLELYRESIRDMDMEKYWEEQQKNPMNDKSNPNMDDFSRFILPRTPSDEEIELIFSSMQTDAAAAAEYVDPATRPGCLFENMVMKIAGYTARGVLWYQGESDDVPGMQKLYTGMLTGLIKDWRQAWKEEKLPFFVVQLPGWRNWLMLHNLDFTMIRRCQEEAANTLEQVYLVSISDVGEERDIHPKDKKTVGHRIALLAEKYIYGKDILCEAPTAVKAWKEGNRIEIAFKNAGESLKVKGKTVNALEVRILERSVKYEARVSGNIMEIILPEDTEERISIYFAQSDWFQVNLYNEAGIPAVPFSFTVQ